MAEEAKTVAMAVQCSTRSVVSLTSRFVLDGIAGSTPVSIEDVMFGAAYRRVACPVLRHPLDRQCKVGAKRPAAAVAGPMASISVVTNQTSFSLEE